MPHYPGYDPYSEPPMPRLDAPPQDPVFDGLPPSVERTEPRRSRLGALVPLVGMIAFIVLALSGAFAALYYTPLAVERAEPVIAALPPTWVAGTGPLVDGVQLAGEPPSRLRWSPDGRYLGWVALDPERAMRVHSTVRVRESFEAPRVVDDPVPWLLGSDAPSAYRASVEGGVVMVYGPAVPDGAVVDVKGQLQLERAFATALYTLEDRAWLAVVGTRDGESVSLHVVEVTPLLRG